MRVSIIAAVAINGVIGRDNQLPWRLSADLKRFKALTMGHHLVMGRKTWESIGRPLPGRTTIVLTRSCHSERSEESRGARDSVLVPRDPSTSLGMTQGVLVAHSLDEALQLAGEDAEVFICGGQTVYEQALRRADRMYITRVHAEVEGDAYFPEFDDVSEWVLADSEHCEPDEKNEYPYSFLTYERAARVDPPAGEELDGG